MERSLFYICCGKQSSQGEKFQCEGQGRRDPKKKAHQGGEQRFNRRVIMFQLKKSSMLLITTPTPTPSLVKTSFKG